MKVDPDDIDLQLHWASHFNNSGANLPQKMSTLYTEFRQALPTLLRYSKAL